MLRYSWTVTGSKFSKEMIFINITYPLSPTLMTFPNRTPLEHTWDMRVQLFLSLVIFGWASLLSSIKQIVSPPAPHFFKMALVFIFTRWTVNSVAKDVLKCSCGKYILRSRCCGSKAQFMDSAVKLLRVVFRRCFHKLLYHQEKDLGKTRRNLCFAI